MSEGNLNNTTRYEIENDVFNSVLMKENCVSVLKNFITEWGPALWDLDYLAECTIGQTVTVKSGKPYSGGQVPKESECCFKEQDLGEFFRYLKTYNDSSTFYYAGYTHFAVLNNTAPNFHSFDWSWAGLKDVGSSKSTLWAGSAGSFTPCHKDSYGCNLHAQLVGQKEWLLWPPEHDLCPTRLPYEESSTFCSVDVLKEMYAKSALRIVTTPGEVIFIPKHWWHLTRNLDTSVSINTWIDLASDSFDRLQEAITRLLVCALKRSDSPESWLNPGEEISSAKENEMLLKQSISQCRQSSSGTNIFKKDILGGKSYLLIDKAASTPENLIQCFPLLSQTTILNENKSEKSEDIIDTLINSIVCDSSIMDSIANKLLKCIHGGE